MAGLASAAVAALALVLVFGTIHASGVEPSNYKGVKREFYLFNDHVNGFNDTRVGIPGDKFSISSITVKKGDIVVIHFYNIEEKGGDNHSFTMNEKPYNINTIVQPNSNQTITCTATNTGVYTYFCSFHAPSMRGQLIVEPPTQDDVAAQQ